MCTKENICVVIQHGRKSECSENNGTKVVDTLSNIALNCTTVHIYVSSGTHILNRHLIFTDFVEEARIDGAPHGLSSTIKCMKSAAGIRFSENRKANKVFISNLSFEKCHRERDIGNWNSLEQVALYFKYASYLLDNISVRNTEGYGVYSQDSRSQEISQCILTITPKGTSKFSIVNCKTILPKYL